MYSKCFETEGLSSGRRLYIQLWYSVLYSVLYSVFYRLQLQQKACYKTFKYQILELFKYIDMNIKHSS
jgi:hypothetical protein